MGMNRLEVKEGFQTVTPYFVVVDAAGFIEFMTRAFGAEEVFRAPRPDGSIEHADVRIGDSRIELGGATGEHAPWPMSMHLYVPDADDVFARAIEAGAASLYDPVDQPYGDREGGAEDRWGNHWTIATHRKGPAGSYAPGGFRAVTTGLRVANAVGLVDFLVRAFDAEEIHERTLAPDGSLVHGEVRIGDSIVELSDPRGDWKPMPGHIHLYVENVDAVYARAIEAGATSQYEPQDMPYGERSGSVVDPFGSAWYVATPSR